MAYPAALYAFVWTRPSRQGQAYLAVLLPDLLFLFLICRWSVEPMSSVYLVFYVLVALHAFYFGFRVGLGAAVGFGCLYVLLSVLVPPEQRIALADLVLRVGFAFVIAISLAFVSRELRNERDRLRSVGVELEKRNRTLEQVYRYFSIGRLVEGLSHHVNNPLAGILAQIEVVKRRCEGTEHGELCRRNFDEITGQVRRLADLVRLLTTLSPAVEEEKRRIDLRELVESVVLLFGEQAAARRIGLERQIPKMPDVVAPENDLRQVLVNLLSNAFDAVDDGGRIVVDAAFQEEAGRIELRVSDDGCGIPPDIVDDVYRPFFTTKDPFKGIGLGLPQSLAIVRRVGGAISVRSAPGSGTTFTVSLPVDS